MFEVHLGIPEMEELWNRLENRHQNGSATKAEEKLRRRSHPPLAVSPYKLPIFSAIIILRFI